MTLKEMKIKTFSLIEEYYPDKSGLAEDEDVLNKINGVVNSIQLDLMKYRKINKSIEIDVTSSSNKTLNLKDLIEDLYQINKIIVDKDVDYNMPNEITIVLPDDYEGKVTIYYFKYPKLVDIAFKSEGEQTADEASKEYDESFEFELEPDILEIMPYGIAADLLKMDMISSYGRYFDEKYKELKSMIDPRRNTGNIKVTGGIDI